MAQPPPRRQLMHSGPAGLLKCAISSAEQHIVHAPQDFPGAAVNQVPSRSNPPADRGKREASLSLFLRQRERIGKSASSAACSPADAYPGRACVRPGAGSCGGGLRRGVAPPFEDRQAAAHSTISSVRATPHPQGVRKNARPLDGLCPPPQGGGALEAIDSPQRQLALGARREAAPI